jgi:phage portal protein BeeE
MTMKAVDAQLIEQLKWSAGVVCSTFHVPAYKVGVGDPPPYQNIEATEQQYYSQCLQKFFECIELCLDEGLGLVEVNGHDYGVEFDLDDLLRMDTATLIESEKNAVSGGIKAPNESRRRLNLAPTPGGDSVFLQQQNYSLEALAKRDAQADPFASRAPSAPPPPPVPKAADDLDEQAIGVIAAWELKSQLDLLAA